MHNTTGLKRFIALVVSGSLMACTSLQQLPERGSSTDERARRQVASISVGDSVKVNPKQGEPLEIVVTQIDAERVTGTRSGQSVTLALSEIASFEHRRFDALRTSLLALGLAFIALGQYTRGASKIGNP